ncbi:MAG: MFS transporter [Bacillota bacterium]|jgi:MFS family permease
MNKQTSERSWVSGAIILSFGWFLLYATRTTLSSALKDIGEFWALSEGFLGFIASSFFFSYALLQIPTGILADKYGARKMIVIGFATKAVGLLLGVLSTNPYQFLLSRVLTGAGQAHYFACQQAILYFILPPDKRARGIAMTSAGAGLGSASGFLLGKFLASSTLGWKMPFVVLAMFAGAYSVIVLRGVPEPPFGAARSSEKPSGKPSNPKPEVQRPHAQSAHGSGAAGPVSKLGPRWRFLFFMAACHFLTMYSFNMMLTWLPYYFETVRGFEGGLAAVIPVVMPLVMAPAAIVWGIAADKHKSRDFVLWICLPIAGIAVAMIPAMGSPVLLVLSLMVYGMTGKLAFDPVLTATVSENAPRHAHGLFLASFNLAASLAMVVAPSATGFMAQKFGDFTISFVMAGAFHFVALLAFVQAKRSIAKPDPYGEQVAGIS